jgi:tRNA threonylcarbamoyladenosine biosynthesis protein TsaE
MEKLVIGSESELTEIAQKVIQHASMHDPAVASIVALSGELGAGKTALVKRIAKELGVEEDVTSPTFLIMRRYETAHARFTSLVHIDAYRIEEEREMIPLHFTEVCATAGALVCIEWPERIASLVPRDAMRLTIAIEGEGRSLSFS